MAQVEGARRRTLTQVCMRVHTCPTCMPVSCFTTLLSLGGVRRGRRKSAQAQWCRETRGRPSGGLDLCGGAGAHWERDLGPPALKKEGPSPGSSPPSSPSRPPSGEPTPHPGAEPERDRTPGVLARGRGCCTGRPIPPRGLSDAPLVGRQQQQPQQAPSYFWGESRRWQHQALPDLSPASHRLVSRKGPQTQPSSSGWTSPPPGPGRSVSPLVNGAIKAHLAVQP